MKRRLTGARVIITGASSGIGRQLALQMARAGAKLVLNARRAELLESLKQEITQANSKRKRPTFVEIVVGDITQESTRREVIARTIGVYGGLDVLVNNAGGAATGLFETGSPERLKKVMDLNFVSVVEMTRLALPLLKREMQPVAAAVGVAPIIVNFSSIVGYRGVTHYSEYCAAKFAVRGFSESLRTELDPYGIDVLVVSPGSTDTEFFTNYIENTGEPTWPNHSRVTPQYVAKKVVRAIRRGKHRIMPFFLGHVMCFLSSFAPSLMDRIMLHYARVGQRKAEEEQIQTEDMPVASGEMLVDGASNMVGEVPPMAPPPPPPIDPNEELR